MSAPPHVGIIGGGYAGLTAAYRLLNAGYRVTVFERSHQLGGLAMTYDLLGTRLEKYYHHLFTSDVDILDLVKEFGLEVLWPSPRVGMLNEGTVYPFTGPGDLLRFSPMPLPDRVRFGAVMLFLQRYPNGARFENVTAAEWFRKFVGPRAFRAVIGPMLRAKFERNAEKIAMVWMWGKMRLRGTSRAQGGLKESLGYIKGSFGTFTDRLVAEVSKRGGVLRPNSVVRGVEGIPSPQLENTRLPGFLSQLRPSDDHVASASDWAAVERRPLAIVTDHGRFEFDAVLSTLAPTLLADIATGLPESWKRTARSLEYSGVLCTTLVLRRSLTPIYWMYVSDAAVPFGGLIEHTNYIPSSDYQGRHILYVSHYTYPDESWYHMDSHEVMSRYVPALKRVNPAFDESWIEKRVFAHDKFAQPIVGVNYADRLLPYATPVPGLFSASMAQIYPEDRGTNYAVRAGNQSAEVVKQFLEVGSRR